jgi:cysteine synthase A
MPNVPRLARSILDVIGGTPLVELCRCVKLRGLRGRLLLKLESANPGASKKDRVALEVIRRARADGTLREGQTVVELTSGNMGAGLAIVCRALGHPFVAVMSRGNSVERARQMAAFGAEVVLVEQAPGAVAGQVSGADLDLVEARTLEIVSERGAFRADQFVREANALAHERTTGPEIWEQSEGQVDVFLDLAGTAGTFTGVTRALRERNPKLRSYMVEPESAAVLSGRPVTNPRGRGGGSCRILDRSAPGRGLAAPRGPRGRRNNRVPRVRQWFEVPEHRPLRLIVAARSLDPSSPGNSS